LSIDIIKTTPYRPECNGTIECMRRKLGFMLRKAQKGLDWAAQVSSSLYLD